MYNLQDRLTAGAIGMGLPESFGESPVFQDALDAPLGLIAGDRIRRFAPAAGLTAGTGAGFFNFAAGGMLGIIQQLLGVISGLASQFGGASSSNEQPFANASGSSNGDPHLVFNGTTASGAAASQRFDSMSGHQDLSIRTRSRAGTVSRRR